MKRFPVEGNVICGGYEQNVYKADWSLLNTGDAMRWQQPKDFSGVPPEKLRLEIDVADLVSEKYAGYVFQQPQNGWTDMRVLPDPLEPTRDMFDGGRRIAAGKYQGFVAKGLVLGRTAQEGTTTVRVRLDGADAGTFTVHRTNGWEETPFVLPAELVHETTKVTLTNEGPGDLVDYHMWLMQ